MTQSYRIGIGTIFTESNHLVGTRTDLADFERTELRRGEEILSVTDGVVGGALSVLHEQGAEIAPLLVASAYPGGILTRACYTQLKTELLQRLTEALPLDGVLLPLHGGAAVEGIGDLEGDLVDEIRKLLGGEIPIVATLDCHAHVTEKMVGGADALLAWETYPHKDTFSTGARGARMHFDILEGKVRPAMAMAKVPVIVSPFKGNTDPPGPFADIMGFTKSLERQDNVVSTSAFLVQPHLDLSGMGGGGLVITDGDIDKANELATEIAGRFWQRRFDLTPKTWTAGEAIAEGLKVTGKPMLLLEASDCVGGGAAGDSVTALHALLKVNCSELSLAMVVDPEAAAECHRAGVGSELTLTLGHRVDPRWGRPLSVTGKIEKLTDGNFLYSGGIWSGQWGKMGPSAKLKVDSVEILISSHPTYDWADEQYLSMDMDTRSAKFVVVKNPMNYRVGYAGRFEKEFLLNTPGPTTANLLDVEYKELKPPYYPKDQDIAGAGLTVFRHVSSGPRT